MIRVYSLQFFGAYTLPLAVSVRPRALKTAKQKEKKTNKHAKQSHVSVANAAKNANEKGNEMQGKGSLSY